MKSHCFSAKLIIVLINFCISVLYLSDKSVLFIWFLHRWYNSAFKSTNSTSQNIFNNSIKYANTNIDVELEDSNEYYLVSIRDYGKGIADEDFPFIFEKFYRGKNATGKNGTGLGLYIVKYMIEKMGGKVDLISNDGLCVKLFFKKIVS